MFICVAVLYAQVDSWRYPLAEGNVVLVENLYGAVGHPDGHVSHWNPWFPCGPADQVTHWLHCSPWLP